MADDDRFRQRTIPLRVAKDSVKQEPFVVAYENTDGFRAGQRIDEDRFHQILRDYDAVMVHWKEGDHPSQHDHFLLYGEAKEIDLAGEDIEHTRKRKRSKEVVGDFGWYDRGRHLAVEMSIGLHCLDDDLWKELP